MKKRLIAAVLLAALLTGSSASAWDDSAVQLSPWAISEVQSAYDSGAISSEFDLGVDYTRPVTRGELARMTVDLVAHEQQVSINDLTAQLGVELQAVPLAPAQPIDETAPETPDAEPSTGETPEDEPSTPPLPEEDAGESDDANTEVSDTGTVPPETPTSDEDTAPPLDGAAEELPEEERPEGTPPEEQPSTEVPTQPIADWGDPLDGGLPYVADGSFSDTQSVYIEIAARLGIVTGAEGRFRPADPITRAEAAAMMQRCMTVLGCTEANRQPQQFSDNYKIPRWAVTAVKYISGRTDTAGQSIMGGSNGQFAPLDTYTVEQAILSLRRMQSSLAVADVAAGWRDAPGYDSVQLTLTFGGDCTLGRGHNFAYTRSFDEMYDLQGPAYFFSGIPEFFNDDLTMVNFEGTLTTATTHANKTFAFKGRPEYAKILEAGSIDVVSLANNHSMDYLQRGYDDTIRYLSPYVAVSAYSRMPIVTVKGIRIGFASNVGWSFDTAQKNFITGAIRDLRARGAQLIVFNYHWGIEKSYRSDATQRAIGHYCIDQGADLVIGHHPHVVQEVEVYNGKPIAYSLGNLVFGGNSNPSDKNCLIFRQNYTFDLDSQSFSGASHQAIPYRISSVTWKNDYHPVKAS